MTSANHGDGPGKTPVERPFEDRIAALMATPASAEKLFSDAGITYQSIYRQARAIHCGLQALSDQAHPVLLGTESRALTAAALLAAAGDTPPLVIPYALTRSALAEIHKAMPIQAIITDRPGEMRPDVPRIEWRPSKNPTEPLQPGPCDRTMVYLFTGGSTGRPQIWPKTARNLFGEAFLLQDFFRITPRDRLLATVVPYHIFGLLFSVLAPLAAGARLVAGIPTYPQEIVRQGKSSKATILVSVPLHYRSLKGLDYSLPDLRRALSSAGRLEPEDGDAFHRQTGVGVTEIYGSTETGGIATRSRSAGETALTPLPGVDWKIREERLHVRSPFLSPGLTSNPEEFFRTGDRAAGDALGGFSLQGRADGIVKVGGKRVDLEAVAEALKRNTAVRDAVVISRPGRKGRETDILAVVESTAAPAYLRQQLAQSVEAYALPRRIVTVDRLPVSSTGKYDRRAIEQLYEPRLSKRDGRGD